MRAIDLIVAASLLLASPSAVCAQDCFVCDSEIVMTRPLAECFLAQSDATLAEMRSQNLSYALVNLGVCEGVAGGTRGAGDVFMQDASRMIFPWSVVKDAISTSPREPTTTFILDEASILCLDAAIRADEARFDPAGAFRPSEMCR
jgi:hypothetical protein